MCRKQKRKDNQMFIEHTLTHTEEHPFGEQGDNVF